MAVEFDLAINVTTSEIIPSGPDAFPEGSRDAASLSSFGVMSSGNYGSRVVLTRVPTRSLVGIRGRFAYDSDIDSQFPNRLGQHRQRGITSPKIDLYYDPWGVDGGRGVNRVCTPCGERDYGWGKKYGLSRSYGRV